VRGAGAAAREIDKIPAARRLIEESMFWAADAGPATARPEQAALSECSERPCAERMIASAKRGASGIVFMPVWQKIDSFPGPLPRRILSRYGFIATPAADAAGFAPTSAIEQPH
jgi:hypothetical protein